ncbi:MAG: deiodinase-like protein [Planctomycetota bacterium]
MDCRWQPRRSGWWAGALLTSAVIAAGGGCQGTPVSLPRENPSGRADFEDISVGMRSIDFVLRDIRGRSHALSELNRGRVLVLQFASMTCPHYVDHLDDVAAVMQAYRTDDVMFVTVYTEEAHPDYLPEDQRPKTWEERRDLAARASYEYDYQERGKRRRARGTKAPSFPNRLTLVDEPPAWVGRLYGCDRDRAPNPAFVLDRQGVVVAKAGLVTGAFLRKALADALSAS